MTLLSTIRESTLETYDPDIAYLLSVISTWCYADEHVLEQVLGRESMAGEELDVLSYEVRNPALPVDANGFLVSFDEDFHVLSFRGTEPTELLDVLTDALVEKHIWDADEDEWVHRGFFLSMDVLWPELMEDLSELEGDLYITGHSLGGAIAVLTGRRILDSGFKSLALQGVYTFGQPMVGNARFAKLSEGLNLHRHVYDKDVVTFLPPIGVGAGDYVHFGNLYKAFEGPHEKMWNWVVDGGGEPTSCHISEVLPAFLTPLMARLKLPNVPLLAGSAALRATGLGLSLLSNLGDVLEAPTVMGRRLSFEDHIPTHYVDVSRASQSADAHSESATKRSAQVAAEAA
ncbi:MAG: lipase family protein [Woeseiaceae bacterium]|nr:lipase family protein [Woeseiaceae bacterium]